MKTTKSPVDLIPRHTLFNFIFEQRPPPGSGGSFISQNDFRLHFGLGKATVADVSVRWQDGKVETFAGITAGQVVTIEEGKGITRKQPYTSENK